MNQIQKEKIDKTINTWKSVSEKLFNELKGNEELSINLGAEQTDFVRFSKAKIRQETNVFQEDVSLKLCANEKHFSLSTSLYDLEENQEEILKHMRETLSHLSPDPFFVGIENLGESKEEFLGNYPEIDQMIETIFHNQNDLDFCGLLGVGPQIMGNINSKGQSHLFVNDLFDLDYSAYHPSENAIKGSYSGANWNDGDFQKKISFLRAGLETMNKKNVKIAPGKHRTYLAPAALHELVELLNWNGLSFSSYKQNSSNLMDLFEENRLFSKKFNLTQDFSLGIVPRFNFNGDLRDQKLEILKEGKLVNPIVSRKSEKEYGQTTNLGNDSESVEAMSIDGGELKEEEILKEIDNGLYISNLHYLNWSDQKSAKVTGMTRYACYKVEDGEIVAPIENLRFDDSFYSILGDQLESLTNNTEMIISTSSYGKREVSGAKMPGALVNQFNFNL